MKEAIDADVLEWCTCNGKQAKLDAIDLEVEATKEFFNDRDETLEEIKVGWGLAPGTYPGDLKGESDVVGWVRLGQDFDTFDEAMDLENQLCRAIFDKVEETEGVDHGDTFPVLISGVMNLPVEGE